MNPVTTPRYEWKTLPWRELERVVFKLQTRIFRASQRPSQASMTRTDHRGAGGVETRTDGRAGKRGTARALAQPRPSPNQSTDVTASPTRQIRADGALVGHLA